MAIEDDLKSMGLSDAELEAMEGEDDAFADLRALAEGAGDLDGEDEAGTGDEAGGEADTAGQGGDGGGAEPQPDKTAPVLLEVGDLDQLKSSVQTIEAEIQALKDRWNEGDDLDLDEYTEQLAALQEKRADAKADLAQAENKIILNEQAQKQAWLNSIEAFKRGPALKDGVDYDKDPAKMAEWDRAVRFLATDPANADKDGQWFLSEAHAMVKARFGIGAGKSSQTVTDPTREAINARRAKGGERVPHLAQMPQAGAEAVDQGEFSHLDKLSGLALERALARMSPEQQERYLIGEAA
jgi:hypothetical protein